MKGWKTLCTVCFAAILFTGCGSRPISQQLVVSALGIDVSQKPWMATLEILREEERICYTVSGESLSEICAEVERRYGYPVYWGAMECALFSGVKDWRELRTLLRMLYETPQIGANLQIGLCEDVVTLLSEETDGAALSSLLTGHYTRSNDYSLNRILGLLESEGSGTLLPMVTVEDKILRMNGFVPSHSGDYSHSWKGNAVSGMLLQRIPEQTIDIYVAEEQVSVELRNCRQGRIQFSAAERPQVSLSLTAVVQSAERGKIPRRELERAVKEEIARQLGEITAAVLEKGDTDLFSVGRMAAWLTGGETPAPAAAEFFINLNLQDPKGLLRQ